MSNAKKCDRCTKFYVPYEGKETTMFSNMIIFATDSDGSKPWPKKVYDLCEGCMKELCGFIHEKLN